MVGLQTEDTGTDGERRKYKEVFSLFCWIVFNFLPFARYDVLELSLNVLCQRLRRDLSDRKKLVTLSPLLRFSFRPLRQTRLGCQHTLALVGLAQR